MTKMLKSLDSTTNTYPNTTVLQCLNVAELGIYLTKNKVNMYCEKVKEKMGEISQAK